MSKVDRIIERLKRSEPLTPAEMNWLCERAEAMLSLEDNVIVVPSPVVIVGDIHGQFFDLLDMFQQVGMPPEQHFLFLGDLVDRGYNSVAVLGLILALKVRYPDRVNVLRGNHESRQLNQNYGFYDECRLKQFSWQNIIGVFDLLPIAAVIDDRVFCVHGGLSESARTLDQIRVLRRRQELPTEGAFSELLWSDPNPCAQGFQKSDRGAGVYYGEDTVAEFLQRNNLELVVRSHQLVMEGFEKLFHDRLVTVWSAPNYTYRCGNLASVLRLDENLAQQFIVFKKSDRQEREEKQHKVVLQHFQ